MESQQNVLAAADATHTPVDDTRRVPVEMRICNKRVPPAAESILGQCVYYYRPIHAEYIDKTGVATWETVKAWATGWNPFDDVEIAKRLLRNRDQLILAESTHGDWSRHASFMMRHIGCGHRPPDYYVSYGYYYCSTYGERLKPRLSGAGQDWLDDARLFLHENLEDGLDDNMDGDRIEVPCKRYPHRSVAMSVTQHELEVENATFKRFAFKTHVPAYLDAGLADLPIADLARIGGQPNIEEWLDGETWRQAIDSGTEVLKDKAMAAGVAIGEAAHRGGEAVERALESLTRHLQ